MLMVSRLSTLLVVVATFGVTELSYAQPWVAKMFAVQEHDFGTVARGADTVYRFEAKNIYKQDIQLLSVRSSCGCTTPSLENQTLKTGDVGYVVASFNTRTFRGNHGATLTVTVAWDDNGIQRRGEAQLRVHGNVRSDIVFQPGAIKFENVGQGETAEQRVRVTYDGRSDWRIVDVRGTTNDLEAELTESQRYSGRVGYDLLVRLRDTAAAGYFNEQLILVTNDQQNLRIPLHVAGRVIPAVSVAPESLVLGEVARGQQVSKKVVVRGRQPFRIVSIDCDEQCFRFQTDDAASERHVVEIVFDAQCDVGQVKKTIRITTDLGDGCQASLTAYATVVPADSPDADTAGAASNTIRAVASE